MGKKLYVGNLPFSADDSALTELFSQVGQVESAQVVVDRATGRSKGFGFVEMSSDEEANSGISKYDGTELDGRTISVSEARPPSSGPRRGGGGGGGGGGRSYGGGGGGRGGGGGYSGR